MKAKLYDLNGDKKEDIELSSIFSTKIREDLVAKYAETEKFIQPYAPAYNAGRQHSASGTISHKRHEWKGHYGKGISRVPRKTMWRRGTQFFWIAAEVTQARGGRRAHPPHGIGRELKINKKEQKSAINAAFAATANKDYVLKRYASLSKIESVPKVIESLPKKTKDLFAVLKKIFNDSFNLVIKKKVVRAGKGKLRGRKYKSNAGLLLITGKNEKAKFKGIDVKPVNGVVIADLYPLGRLTLYTKKAMEELK